MHTEITIDIAVPPERVWEVMMDVERWPEWTKSVKHIDMLMDGPLARGSKVRIAQPKAPVAVWTVTEVQAGSFFEWGTSSPAISSVATHRIEPVGTGSTVTLSVHHSGLFTLILGWWLRPLTRKYLDMEAQGLKARAEAATEYSI